MRKNFKVYSLDIINDYFEALINLLIFLPYFFSITSLAKTLFSPWKKLISHKTSVGFSFNEWITRQFYNGISRCIGFVMR
ncbi:MAG: hypothetical protein Q7R95_05520, partial [bacterium]|nr:hypothetical protein [bacterium]